MSTDQTTQPNDRDGQIPADDPVTDDTPALTAGDPAASVIGRRPLPRRFLVILMAFLVGLVVLGGAGMASASSGGGIHLFQELEGGCGGG